jgi:hypothetical protein
MLVRPRPRILGQIVRIVDLRKHPVILYDPSWRRTLGGVAVSPADARQDRPWERDQSGVSSLR